MRIKKVAFLDLTLCSHIPSRVAGAMPHERLYIRSNTIYNAINNTIICAMKNTMEGLLCQMYLPMI